MTVREIYRQYKIPAFLQLHQLRVTSVAKQIVQHFDSPLDERSIILACLFHDMGNIIKIDFSRFPESFEPEGVAYWKHVQEDFFRRFGLNEHQATIAIGHELHLPLQVMKYIDGVGFGKLEASRDTPSYEQKIVEYADTRVAPHGVTSMIKRLEEARERYAKRESEMPKDAKRYDELHAAAIAIEQQIFAKTQIRPEQITETSIQPLIEKFNDFQVA